MGNQKLKQGGFHVIEVGIVLVVIGIIGFVLFRVLGDKPETTNNSSPAAAETATDNGPPIWEYSQEKHEWFVKSGEAPSCEEPFKLDMTPVDMSKVTHVLLPGAYRGFSYKAHGAFRVADSTAGKVEVRMPIEGNLRGVGRYYEAIPGHPPELQYMMDIENDCGIAMRFDHLHTLTPEFQAVAEKSPPPRLNETGGSGENMERISIPFKADTVIATVVGFPDAKNYGFDFGLYDYRQRNEISKNAQWAAIHDLYAYYAFHSVCWINLLPDADAAKAEALAKDKNNYNSNKPFNLTSDVCKFAPYDTLDFNNGQPTDG